MKQILFSFFYILLSIYANAKEIENSQVTTKRFSDTDTIIDTLSPPINMLHARPLYIDLIRDLGALEGEKEWNTELDLGLNVSAPLFV